jgi:hypothetical protein
MDCTGIGSGRLADVPHHAPLAGCRTDCLAGADDAADGGGEEPNREDEEEIQGACLREARLAGPHTGNMTRNSANKIRDSASIQLKAIPR